MWQRAELKERAKSVLKGSYWKAFLVSIVVGMVAGGSSGSGVARNTGGIMDSSGDGFDIGDYGGYGFDRADLPPNFYLGVFIAIAIAAVGIIIVVMLVNIFIGYNIRVGGMRYFIQAAQDDVNMGYLGYGFTSGRYLNIVKSMFWKDLINFLWYLLLFIPGVVKSYSYYMVPYILADNPEIGHKRALELSMQMTHGEKWAMFVLDLSFIGWYLLGAIPCGLGILFVRPYDQATHAELYLFLREQAVTEGLCDYRELNLVRQVKTIE